MTLPLRATLAASSTVVVLSVVTGCGGSHGLTARQVERAFSRAGVPFASEQDRTQTKPYLRASRAQSILLPRRAQPFAKHVTAFLIATNPVTFRGEFAYVFDSSASARGAVEAEPLSRWVNSNYLFTRERVANVVIFAPGSRRVHAAVSSLKRESG